MTQQYEIYHLKQKDRKKDARSILTSKISKDLVLGNAHDILTS